MNECESNLEGAERERESTWYLHKSGVFVCTFAVTRRRPRRCNHFSSTGILFEAPFMFLRQVLLSFNGG